VQAMIGVIANPLESDVVQEFFELFKTPWEWYRNDRKYDVLLCAGDGVLPDVNADLVLFYSGQEVTPDIDAGVEIVSRGNQPRLLQYKDDRIPIYGDRVTFQTGDGLLVDEGTRQPAIYMGQWRGIRMARVGYDLFAEIRALLTVGQPASNAGIPTLELHIALLRELILANGILLAEIPPVPTGYQFIACLTHDIDHPAIRFHKFDHTALGFLYRAVFGSVLRVFRKQLTLKGLFRNWVAAIKLPLVHLGLARDFWEDFDRYIRFDMGLRSTFFVIPFRDHPGRLEQGAAPSLRASRYGAADISSKVRQLMAERCEIGLHGIDAWLDGSYGRKELEEIRRVTGMQVEGARMHWLCFGEKSHLALEQAGIDYDSTVGYNETVGYRAGTTQVYRPLGVTRLLELPLHIMDTALFYSSGLNRSSAEPQKQVDDIIDYAVKFGGVVTVNWHDRSIAPERCWDDFYIDLVRELKSKGAWFATAADTIAWFRQRRLAEFEDDNRKLELARVKSNASYNGTLPGLQLRVYNSHQQQPLQNPSRESFCIR
jgi:hypothetical protein